MMIAFIILPRILVPVFSAWFDQRWPPLMKCPLRFWRVAGTPSKKHVALWGSTLSGRTWQSLETCVFCFVQKIITQTQAGHICLLVIEEVFFLECIVLGCDVTFGGAQFFFGSSEPFQWLAWFSVGWLCNLGRKSKEDWTKGWKMPRIYRLPGDFNAFSLDRMIPCTKGTMCSFPECVQRLVS